MLKKLCLFLLLPVLGYSQSLDLSIENSTAENGYSTFRLGQTNVTFSDNSIDFSGSNGRFSDYMTFGVSPDHTTIGVLQNAVEGARAYLLDTTGDTLITYPTISLNYDDPSLAVYPLNSGSTLIRNNIANFTLYNSFGNIVTSGSGSSQSEEGEVISKVAMDANGKTVLIYVPKIKGNGGLGSTANLLRENNSTDNIFFSSDRQISFGGVSENGQFVILITAREGTGNQVIIMDRFGNELNTITSDEDLTSARLTSDGSYITLLSSRRALVYSTIGGERIGSTSFRTPLLMAQYFPEDATIVGITGNPVENTEILKEIEFHAIHIGQSEIARRELNGALGMSSEIRVEFERLASGRYRMTGANKSINLDASF